MACVGFLQHHIYACACDGCAYLFMFAFMFVLICSFGEILRRCMGGYWVSELCYVYFCVSNCMYEYICVTVCLSAYELCSPCKMSKY